LSTRNVPTAEYNRQTEITNTADVVGQLLTRAVSAGQAIPRAALTDPGLSQQIPTQDPERPARDKAYPVQVNNLSGVADQVKPGDFVDVVATFSVEREVFLPVGTSIEQIGDTTREVVDRELTVQTFQSTKTIVQRAQVLRIVRPPVTTAEGTPVAQQPESPEEPPQDGEAIETDDTGQPIARGGRPVAQADAVLTQGEWVVILAINDQEVELIEFAQSTESRIAMVLRGAEDNEFESTIGVTMDLLVSEFGLPLPRPLPPRVLSEEESFNPDPTPTPGIPGRVPVPTRVP
jgi:pilus assembly protein CpaB